MSPPPMPTPADLDHDPELAALAVLDAALQAARAALLSTQAQLRDGGDGPRHDLLPTFWAAGPLVLLAEVLREQIASYREAIEYERHRQRRNQTAGIQRI